MQHTAYMCAKVHNRFHRQTGQFTPLKISLPGGEIGTRIQISTTFQYNEQLHFVVDRYFGKYQ